MKSGLAVVCGTSESGECPKFCRNWLNLGSTEAAAAAAAAAAALAAAKFMPPSSVLLLSYLLLMLLFICWPERSILQGGPGSERCVKWRYSMGVYGYSLMAKRYIHMSSFF